MNNPRFTLTWISAALLLPLAAQATAQITSSSLASSAISYTDIADTFTGSTYSQIVPKPAINNAGQVAFSVLARSNIQYMYVTSVLGSSFINVADTAHGYTGISYFTLNNAGTVVFDATSSTGPNANQYGIFSGNGGAVSTVADSTTTAHPYYNGGTPRISDTGSTVFIGTNPSSGQQSVVRKSGTFSTVATYNGGQFEYLYDAAINNSGFCRISALRPSIGGCRSRSECQ